MHKPPLPPWPLMEVAVEPKISADHEKLGSALTELAAEDSSFRATTDTESGQTILKGLGELHLDSKIDILTRAYRIDLNVGAPQVAYREMLTLTVDIDYTHKHLTGGAGQFARVKIHVEPDEPSAASAFASEIVDGAAPANYVSGVRTGVETAMEAGVVAGFPVVGVKVHLLDVAFHKIDSSALAFEIAARAAFREALRKGEAVLLEPLMNVQIVTPEDCKGSIITDLNSRRGVLRDQFNRPTSVVVRAIVPLANMFGYTNTLRSKSDGRAEFSMTYARYERVTTPSDASPPPAAAMALRA